MTEAELQELVAHAQPEKWERFTDDDNGWEGVKFDDGHNLIWDMEGTCPKCYAILDLIAQVPTLLRYLENYKATLRTLNRFEQEAEQLKRDRNLYKKRLELMSKASSEMIMSGGDMDISKFGEMLDKAAEYSGGSHATI